MENQLGPCSLGVASQSACHQTTYFTAPCRLRNVSELDLEQQELLKRRSAISISVDAQICGHHESLFLTNFESLQRSCCYPFDK
jgi:hypothetical protein